MQESPFHIPLPLEQLFPLLEDAGFALDTARRLRAWRMLNAVGPRVAGDMEQLKLLLCPLFARTPQEQRKFNTIFEQFWADCEKEWKEWPEEMQEEATETEKPVEDVRKPPSSSKTRAKYIGWGLVIVAVIVLGYFGWETYVFEKERAPFALFNSRIKYHEGENHAGYLFQGDTLFFDNESTLFETTKVHWEIKDQESGQVLHQDSSVHTTWIAPEAGKKVTVSLKVLAKPVPNLPKDTSLWHDSLFSTYQVEHLIHCSDPPKIGEIVASNSYFTTGKPYKFSLAKEKSCPAVWELETGGNVSPGEELSEGKRKSISGDSVVTLVFDKEGRYNLNVRVSRPGKEDFCYTKVSKTITVGSNKPFLKLANLQKDQPRQILQVSWLGWTLVLLPLLLAGWFFYRWWKKRNETPIEKTDAELAEKYPIKDDAPYFIPYLAQEEKISVPREFFRIAEILRRRENAERREFDPQRSVRATIAAGGYPTWQDQAKTQPTEFLFLIKCPDERDQQFRLFERLADFMTKRDAPITTYFHDGKFARFWNDSEEKSIDLSQLFRQFSHHRLVVLDDGHGLVHEQRRLFREPSQALLRWQRRLLLTPEAVRDWGKEERLLHPIFPIFPADTEGILQGLEKIEREDEYLPGTFEKWQEDQNLLRLESPQRYRNLSDLDTLRQTLEHDPGLWRWCQALSVTAHPDWALTITAGHAIGVEVTHDRLLALTRLEWLRRNESEEYLRLELLKILDPEDEKAARLAVAAELHLVEEQVKNGFAALEWAASLAVQRFALDPRDKAHKQTIRHLQRLGLLSGGQIQELEMIVDRENLAAGGLKGEKLKEYLDQPEDKPFLTWQLGAAMILSIFAVLGIWEAKRFDMQQKPAPSNPDSVHLWQTVKTLDDEAIRLNNQAVEIGQRILGENSYSRWLGYVEEGQQADTLWGQAIASRRPEVYALADSNRMAYRFSVAAKNFNYYLSDSIRRDKSQGDSLVLRATANAFASMVNASYWQTNDTRRMDAQHAMGLCYFYLKDTAEARKAYHLIIEINPSFFETLLMPVNLQTLLIGIEKTSKKSVPRQIIFRPNFSYLTNKIGRVVIEVCVDRLGNVISADFTQRGSSTLNLELREAALSYAILYKFMPSNDSIQCGTITFNFPNPDLKDFTDSDGDKIPDVDDKCPEKKGKIINFGCPLGLINDEDNDGIEDDKDKCPKIPGTIVTQGCPDTDEDGISDNDDMCPALYGSKDTNGCPDSDSDQIPDKNDQCPYEFGSPTSKGCPDLDGDGISDKEDKCPYQYGNPSNFGCPDNQTNDSTSKTLLERVTSNNRLPIGDTVEDFRLQNVDGRYLTLFDIIGSQGAIIVFTCNHDPFSQLYEQRVIDLHYKFAKSGFPIVAINPNSPLIIPEDSFEKMQERARVKHYPFVYLFDEDQTVYPKFGATRTPHVFILDANHTIRYIGAIDNNPESSDAATKRWVEDAVNALLKGEKPDTEFTRAVGCTIKKKPK